MRCATLTAHAKSIHGKSSCKDRPSPRFISQKRNCMKQLARLVLLLAFVPGLRAQNVQVQEFVLDNGLKLLMVPRKGDPNVAAGWIAKVGSVNERPGITGLSHLFEHMMFKGTHVIGTTDIKKNLEVIA